MIKSNTRQAGWRKRHPLKYLAHLYVDNAIRIGLIKRQPCEVCGAEKVDAHHDDYSKPLLVRWLCRRHHSQHHAKQRRAA
tara:strand:+ start:8092 stop:8331 length:240 start_codon:yes stop_codon:yes gene_type:complete